MYWCNSNSPSTKDQHQMLTCARPFLTPSKKVVTDLSVIPFSPSLGYNKKHIRLIGLAVKYSLCVYLLSPWTGDIVYLRTSHNGILNMYTCTSVEQRNELQKTQWTYVTRYACTGVLPCVGTHRVLMVRVHHNTTHVHDRLIPRLTSTIWQPFKLKCSRQYKLDSLPWAEANNVIQCFVLYCVACVVS